MIRRAAAAFAAVLAMTAGAAAHAAPLPARLQHALVVPTVSAADSAAFAVDLTTGQAVFSRNASLPLLPASNEKLAVTYGALTALGPGFRIETDVLGDGEQEGTAWDGDIVLKGYGDPTLTSQSLTALAQQVRADGITQVTGHVVGDASWFDSEQTAPGWKPSFYIGESPPLSALIVNRGLVGSYTSHNPALSATQLFRKALAAAGVHFAGIAELGTADEAAVPLGSVDSPPLASIVRWMDRNSDNFTA